MVGVNYAECRKLANYAEYCYAEFSYAECHYAECHYAQCRGTLIASLCMLNQVSVSFFVMLSVIMLSVCVEASVKAYFLPL
jgi:hypothetical protein